MELLNADGSIAEMSGNGIRCLAQAVFQAGEAAPPTLRGRDRRPACAPSTCWRAPARRRSG